MTAKCSNQLSTFVNLQIRLIPQLKELASRWATASLSNVQHSRSSISEWEKKKLNLFINELVCDLNDKKQRLSKEHVNNQEKMLRFIENHHLWSLKNNQIQQTIKNSPPWALRIPFIDCKTIWECSSIFNETKT